MSYSIAIDGPAGVGKSTVAKMIADRKGCVYVDTGAMYRTIAVFLYDSGIDPANPAAVEKSLEKAEIGIRFIDGVQHMFVNGKDVTDRLRTEEISAMASRSSSLPQVRNKLTELQRSFAKTADVVMEGRDIGTVILPNATLKIFLTARPEVRAGRRFLQLSEQGKLGTSTYESILKDIEERDYRDSHRETAPLKAAPDAVTVDTSDCTAEEAIGRIIGLLEKKLGN